MNTCLPLRGCFITGTDTDAGKTTVTATLLRTLLTLGHSSRAVKPVQTGCHLDMYGQLLAPDLTRYTEAVGTLLTSLGEVLRMFRPACSPHLAAELAGESL